MKILITTDAFPPGGGGSGQSTAALSRALTEGGHDVRVVVCRRNTLGRERRNWEGVPVVEYGVGKRTLGGTEREGRLASFLNEWAEAERFDLAHAQHWLSATATVRASRSLGFPVVVTVRDYWPVCIWSTKLSGGERCPGCSYWRRVLCVGRHRPWLWPGAAFAPPLVGRELERRLSTLREASAVIAVSRHVERALPVDHSVVIPNLVDLNDLAGRKAAGPFPGLPERFALFVGKLEPNKAPDRLLPILRVASVNIPLVVAGEGSLAESLRREASRTGQEVHLPGWVKLDQVLGMMQQAAAVLFPSRWDEPLSRVLLEGLGVGAVLIVEPTGGSEEMIVDGESGLLGRTVDELGAGLRRVVTEDGLALRLRQGALRRAKEYFSKETVLPRVQDLYARVLAGEKVGA
jgi:glycosyltransferase involved in cell wall biosynthesis